MKQLREFNDNDYNHPEFFADAHRFSRMRRSCDAGVGGFILVTLGCWFHCRYNYAKLRIQERTAREGIQSVCQQTT
ncbi:cytochrome c oxidase assembly protein COX20, mitochondrial-like [Halichoerus grypus]